MFLFFFLLSSNCVCENFSLPLTTNSQNRSPPAQTSVRCVNRRHSCFVIVGALYQNRQWKVPEEAKLRTNPIQSSRPPWPLVAPFIWTNAFNATAKPEKATDQTPPCTIQLQRAWSTPSSMNASPTANFSTKSAKAENPCPPLRKAYRRAALATRDAGTVFLRPASHACRSVNNFQRQNGAPNKTGRQSPTRSRFLCLTSFPCFRRSFFVALTR